MGTLSDTTGGTLKEANATWTVAASNTGTVTNLSGTFAGMANLSDTARVRWSQAARPTPSRARTRAR
jgi:hypothetical protein